ncbi:group II intron reverse transcriptase/maturase [Heliobacterium undosum]|uniref:Group II intron reverse transcriptase/maturase n=1 Tax=Heliomicrobium undosum TaxID=121734 RepID=A0A845LCW0_9FIRM|nr:group II intron reverse transcriptase/maturase [Heliomicrobium undosum]MZP31488.1 group II intron reverse transcriptase/maturase [Heliomicrobium undosum]
MDAFNRVKANKGAAGVDAQSLVEYEKNLKDNLYKLWNRMSSGSYFPKPVKGVEIPKKSGGTRLLGVPTVEDRIAQMVGRLYFEPIVERIFHKDSYGYRPGKSAIDAIGTTRKRCWEYDWVIEFDIRKLFDNIEHELLMKAVRKHTECKWFLLYVERWLKAPFQMPDGAIVERTSGTPQGGVISPVLANLFLHYAFDRWMADKNPENPWARYADDGVVHCRTKEEADTLLERLKKRMLSCQLEIHPDKTRIVYCKDANRKNTHEHTLFTFLGYEFRPRVAKNKNGQYFIGFTPAVSSQARKSFRESIREIRRQSNGVTLDEVAWRMNPVIRGWANYFGRFCPSSMKKELSKVNLALVRWAMRRHKSLRRKPARALDWLGTCAKIRPNLFAHWEMGVVPAV